MLIENEGLKDGLTLRAQASLDKLNQTLEAHYKSKQLDFSITTIGRVSASNGGVGYESIRATRNVYYRRLIEAWAAKANTTTKKPLGEKSRSRHVPTDNMLLERITDPALRAIFGQIIAERNRFRNQVNILKQNANVIIDKRPVQNFNSNTDPRVELLPSLSGLLTALEIESLRFAVSEKCPQKHNWEYTQAGQVKEIEYNTEIFPRGFITGLRKLLNALDNQE